MLLPILLLLAQAGDVAGNFLKEVTRCARLRNVTQLRICHHMRNCRRGITTSDLARSIRCPFDRVSKQLNVLLKTGHVRKIKNARTQDRRKRPYALTRKGRLAARRGLQDLNELERNFKALVPSQLEDGLWSQHFWIDDPFHEGLLDCAANLERALRTRLLAMTRRGYIAPASCLSYFSEEARRRPLKRTSKP